jgi:predicted MFS family arabinose efflux permease
MQGSTSAAEIAGPGIAGGMAQIFGPVAAVFVDALSFLVSAVCLKRVQARESWNTERRHAHGLIRQIGEGLRYTARDPYLRTFTLFGAVGNLTLVAVQTLLVIFLIRVVGVGPGPAGFLMASMGVGGVIGAMLSKSVVHRFGTARGMLLCQLYTAPFGLLLPLADKGLRLALFALGAAVLAAGIVAGSVIASSFRQSYCPAHMLGRVSAIVSFLVFGAMPVGALIGGTAGSVLGIRSALWALTALLMLPALLLAFSPVSRRRDLPTRAESTAG